jgi:hypothetical protein
VVIEVEIMDVIKRDETAGDKAKPEKNACDEYTICVLAVWCED